jgi:DNA polymerase-1
VLGALHSPVITAEGYEADDVIATLTVQAVEQGMDVLICTGDRDALQLVNEHVTVLYPRKGVSDLTRFTPEEVEAKYGLSPVQYPDFAALRGDPSDNLPSIPSVGEKTAAKWVREYGSLDALVDQVDTVKGKVGDKLREHLSSVLQNRRLTELDRSVPLELSPADLAAQAWDRNEVHTLFDNLQFRVLRDRLFATLTSAEPEAEGGFDVAEDEVPAGGLGAWLDEHARTSRTGLVFRGTWGRGTGELTGLGWPPPTTTPPSSTSVPPWTPQTSRRWPRGWPTRPPRRWCTRSRARCWPCGHAAGSSPAWSATPRWPRTWRCPGSGPSTWAISPSATCAASSRTPPPRRPS